MVQRDVGAKAKTAAGDRQSVREDANHHFVQPQKVGNGTWKIDACPMDGGA